MILTGSARLPSSKFGHRFYGPEIGNVDEGIVEGGEDTGDTENKFTWRGQSFVPLKSIISLSYLRGPEDRGRRSPGRLRPSSVIWSLA